MNAFKEEVNVRLGDNGQNGELVETAYDFMKSSTVPKYSYNFSWLGRPIIQYPQDIIAMQEIIWSVQPDLIIETGVAQLSRVRMFPTLANAQEHRDPYLECLSLPWSEEH